MGRLEADYIIAGAGLTGAVIARELFDRGCDVLLLDRRNHIGGNVHDYAHPSGIRIHTYGPHFFRTNSEATWNYVNRFGAFHEFGWTVKTAIHGEYVQWPVTNSYIRATCGEGWKASFDGTPSNFEEACLARMPRHIYEAFVKGYTEKQWGVPAHTLSHELAGRFETRDDSDPRFKLHRYQGVPLNGFTPLMEELLRGIPTWLNVDYLQERSNITARKLLIFTGPIDEYFGFRLGKLHYRAQHREHTYIPTAAYLQPAEAVNYPSHDDGPLIRRIEWKRLLPPEYGQRISGTIITSETPFTPVNPDSFEYPFPDSENQQLYARYKELAAESRDVLFCGRLGEYKYYDMDQAVEHGLNLAGRILAEREHRVTEIIELQTELCFSFSQEETSSTDEATAPQQEETRVPNT